MTNINDLASEINRQLDIYAQAVTTRADTIARDVANEAAEKLKDTSPKRTGNYAKSWTVVKKGRNYVVGNINYAYLTHILEKSHALRNGKRSKPKVHIKPVEVEYIKKFEDELLRGL